MFCGAAFAALLLGLPAWLLWMSYRCASDSLNAQAVQPLAESIKWLRRFVAYCAVLLLCYITFLLLVAVVDLGRMIYD